MHYTNSVRITKELRRTSNEYDRQVCYAWCKQQFGTMNTSFNPTGTWYWDHGCVFYFSNPKQAMWFKLRWSQE